MGFSSTYIAIVYSKMIYAVRDPLKLPDDSAEVRTERYLAIKEERWQTVQDAFVHTIYCALYLAGILTL